MDCRNHPPRICQLKANVTTTIPSYLRVHRGPDFADPSPASLGRDAIEKFWISFAEATRWRVDSRSGSNDSSIDLLPVVTDDVGQEPEVAVRRSTAKQLAESAIELTGQVESIRQTLRRQEAELATRAAILGGVAEQQQLADQLEQTLTDAAAACGCSAAAMYLLDDDTEFLKMRSAYRLPADRLEQPARPLRGSRADLEAMVQGVVTIDNLRETAIDTWNCPESQQTVSDENRSTNSIESAICAVITSDDVPVGTLWLFHDQVTEFGPAQVAAARMAAVQLSLHLSGALNRQERSTPAQTPVIQEVAHWQCDSLPVGTSIAKDWTVDGMIESPQSWATGWHAWDVLPDGSLMLAIAEAVDSSIKGAMNATIARAAMASHVGYRHKPSQLLQRVNDTLWQTSTCQQRMSMLYVRVDPETGEGEFASAGSITVMIGSRYGYRPLVDGRGEPLCSDFRVQFISDTFRMMPGEALLAYSPGMEGSGATQLMLGESIRTAMQRTDKNLLATIRRQLANMPLSQERGAVTLMREAGSR